MHLLKGVGIWFARVPLLQPYRYGAGASDPTVPSACELGRVEGRLARWATPSRFDPRPSGAGPEGDAASAAADEFVLSLGKVVAFDRVFLSEDVVHDGQLVGSYSVSVCSAAAAADCAAAGGWKEIVGRCATLPLRVAPTFWRKAARSAWWLVTSLLPVEPARVNVRPRASS